MPSHTGREMHKRAAPRGGPWSATGREPEVPVRDGVRNLGRRTGCEGCDHKTATMARTVQEPWALRNASTVGSGAPDCGQQAELNGIRPNRHSLTVLRLNNSGVQSATETRFRLSSLSAVRFTCDDQRPVGTLRMACARAWTASAECAGATVPATGNRRQAAWKHCKGPSTAIQA